MTNWDYKVWKETNRLQAQTDKEAAQSQREFDNIMLRKYRDEHPTEAEANRIHAGAPCDDPEPTIETTKETCKVCGEDYEDSHIVPRAPYAPFWCPKCTDKINADCGGSWIGAVYQASSHKSPMERA